MAGLEGWSRDWDEIINSATSLNTCLDQISSRRNL
jgi:hypothetical protein